MQTVGLAELKAKLSAYGERAARGEEILVTRYGKPAFRLMPVEGQPYKYANSGVVQCSDEQLTAPPFTDEELAEFGID